MKRIIKSMFNSVGLELRRRPDPSLPFIHKLVLDNQEIQLWITNQHAKKWWYKPVQEMNAEFRSLKSLCVPGGTVIEVGAHHGMLTVAMGIWVGPSGQVHAIEANGDNALTLHANVALNQLNNCTCRHAAVGAVSGTVNLDGEKVATGNQTGKETIVISLDDYCAQFNIQHVDLVKVDVEGYEAKVLDGANKLMSQRPGIALELHLDDIAAYGSNVNEIMDLLSIDDYRSEMLIRSRSWDMLFPFHSVNELPESGIVNLFLTPK